MHQELLTSHSQDPQGLSGDRYPEGTRHGSGTVTLQSSMSTNGVLQQLRDGSGVMKLDCG